MPKVTAIIPAYNIEQYIDKCITSLIEQTLKDIEIIIVNDGSTDRTLEKINNRIKEANNIILIDKENGGQSDARNVALSRAAGEYVAFIDGDDWIDENTLEVLYNKAKENDADIVIYDYEEIYEDGRKNYVKEISEFSEDLKKAYMIAMPGFCNKLYRRGFFIDINFRFPNGIFYEDLAVYPFVAAKAQKVEYVSEPFYKYRMRLGSTMKQQKNSKRLLDIFKVFNLIEESMNLIENASEYNDELEYIYIEHLLHAASLRFIDHKDEDENIIKIIDIMKKKYPNWRKNKYYKKQTLKYKIVCNLLYKKKINLLRKILGK